MTEERLPDEQPYLRAWAQPYLRWWVPVLAPAAVRILDLVGDALVAVLRGGIGVTPQTVERTGPIWSATTSVCCCLPRKSSTRRSSPSPIPAAAAASAVIRISPGCASAARRAATLTAAPST